MSDSDPVANLVHDHVEINQRVIELGKHMDRLRTHTTTPVQSADLMPGLSELRDLLFLHFAREEEGLFPFVVEALPEFEWQVQSMAAAHDGICGGLSRLIHMLTTDIEVTAILGVFDRFERAYGEHARVEAQLLAAVDRAVTSAQRATLGELVRGL
jgi:iron-sulfur cluster repair protein YtfE (RIC family)